MTEAAAQDKATSPPSWQATVVGHERRTLDIAVLRVVPAILRSLTCPGSRFAVECEARPRLWRYYSMANAPRHDGTVDFHVQVIDGGPVSSALARNTCVGSLLRLGAPVGTLKLDVNSRRDIVLAAGARASAAEGDHRAGQPSLGEIRHGCTSSSARVPPPGL